MMIQKALTFRASSIGDALNAKYLLENVRAAHPAARCGIVVAGRGAMIRDLLAAYPWIEVREANRKDPATVMELLADFRASDLVVAPYTKPGGTFSLPSKVIGRLLARHGAYIGFQDASRLSPLLYDEMLPSDPATAPRLLEQEALRAAGIPVSVEQMRLSYLPQPDLLARLGLEGRKYLVVHLFAGSGNRGLSDEKRQQLASALARELPGVPLVFTGSASERSSIERLALPSNARVLAGDLSVQELAALIDCSTLMVSIGTGPSHMASQLGKRPIVLVTCPGIPWVGQEQYGAAAAARIFCDAAACRGRHDFSAAHPSCMENIDMDEVARAAKPHFT